MFYLLSFALGLIPFLLRLNSIVKPLLLGTTNTRDYTTLGYLVRYGKSI